MRNRQRKLLNLLNEIDRIAQKYNINYYLGYGTALGAVREKGFIEWDTDIDLIIDIENYKKLVIKLREELKEKFEIKTYEDDESYNSLLTRVVEKDTDHHLLHIDIFPMVGSPNSKIGKIIFRKITYLNFRMYFLKKVNPQKNYKDNYVKKYLSYILKIILLFVPEKLIIITYELTSNIFPIKKSEKLYNILGSYGYKEFIPRSWLGTPKYVEFESELYPIPEEYDKYLKHIYGDYMTPKKKDYV